MFLGPTRSRDCNMRHASPKSVAMGRNEPKVTPSSSARALISAIICSLTGRSLINRLPVSTPNHRSVSSNSSIFDSIFRYALPKLARAITMAPLGERTTGAVNVHGRAAEGRVGREPGAGASVKKGGTERFCPLCLSPHLTSSRRKSWSCFLLQQPTYIVGRGMNAVAWLRGSLAELREEAAASPGSGPSP
ncbi:hypothetical protein Mp_7g00360 [Marchantia polymorpha subsp. ruderalis]|uniref:Uncharacterized protein n=2 Tax=Marchantia polymorpha TaxID=3197 RepID=A0AAF6BUP9_MARPO|nr:hypothetical protein MARPO_0046s0088 [Marchantia polymorpha]BBN15733.1 hypothetical protein Mp_7g00360 [Marchantia polymorpha subsp. ruderalis]|eukprot:PTQ39270.1 hypothetical protein MARPO_0046s0088 [Marchantia polymorpha]